MSTPSAQILVSVSSERNQSSLQEQLALAAGAGNIPGDARASHRGVPERSLCAVCLQDKARGNTRFLVSQKRTRPHTQAINKSAGPFLAFCADSLARISSLLVSQRCDLTFRPTLAPLRSSRWDICRGQPSECVSDLVAERSDGMFSSLALSAEEVRNRPSVVNVSEHNSMLGRACERLQE